MRSAGGGGHVSFRGGGATTHTRMGGGATFHGRTGGGATVHTRRGGGATFHARTGGSTVRGAALHGRTARGTTFARGGRTGAGVTGRTVGGRAGVGGRTGVRQSAAVHTQLRNSWSRNRTVVSSHAVWRGNRNWWRGNAHFNGYTGARNGYYFAPGYGYYAVPREYWGHRWGIGAFLPLFFLTYSLVDYGDYGLPPPPPGCAWVWVGPNLLLVDIADGYVVDEYYDVF
jgi:Ni/Co efflux regulator RcnB